MGTIAGAIIDGRMLQSLNTHRPLLPAQMRVDISCAAAGPWGLVGTIEDAMAAQARSTIDGFLAFCVSWCADRGAGAPPKVCASEGAVRPRAVHLHCSIDRSDCGRRILDGQLPSLIVLELSQHQTCTG